MVDKRLKKAPVEPKKATPKNLNTIKNPELKDLEIKPRFSNSTYGVTLGK